MKCRQSEGLSDLPNNRPFHFTFAVKPENIDYKSRKYTKSYFKLFKSLDFYQEESQLKNRLQDKYLELIIRMYKKHELKIYKENNQASSQIYDHKAKLPLHNNHVNLFTNYEHPKKIHSTQIGFSEIEEKAMQFEEKYQARIYKKNKAKTKKILQANFINKNKSKK